jgi:pimeloyl-ACP methyl ester carboxylesterase
MICMEEGVFGILTNRYSDSPGTVFNEGLFVSQLNDLLVAMNWGRTIIMGYSLGGAITSGYVSRFPSQIEKVMLIAPAGIM